MKKLVSLLLALVMMLGLCAFASAEEVVEIEIYHNWGSGANAEAMEYLCNAFNEAYAGKYHVTPQYVSGGYADVLAKFNVGYTSNENPVVTIIDACMSLGEKDKNTMIDLTAYAAANDPAYDFGQFYESALRFSTDPADGHVYSVPYGRSTQLMYVNMDLVREAMGEDAATPETWQDIWAICEAWYAKTGKPAYGHPIAGGYWSWYIVTIGGGEYMSADGNAGCAYLNNGWEKALTKWREIIDNGWFEAPGITAGGYWEDFQAGSLPIAFQSSGNLTKAMSAADNAGFDLEVCMLPGIVRDDGSVYRRCYTGGSNLMLANNKTAEETAAGWELVKFFTSKEANIYHSFKTGYILTHVGVEEDPEVLAKWAETPEKKVAYDQMAYLNETHVSAYMNDVDIEIVDTLTSFVYDGLSVADALDQMIGSFESIFPNGVTDTY
ncbi:MAG: extracellular solute-binding protein [Clostridia bacterium]|nr:extracellular solute-binding protein [Clostridia bacterium]